MEDQFVTIRFTAKQYDWIENFRKGKKIEDISKLFRQAIEDMMGASLASSKRNPPRLPSEYLAAYEYHEKLLKEFSKNANAKSRIDKVFKQWKSDFLREWAYKETKKLPRSNLMLDNFKAKPPGRPKKLKKRGRPAEKGLES